MWGRGGAARGRPGAERSEVDGRGSTAPFQDPYCLATGASELSTGPPQCSRSGWRCTWMGVLPRRSWQCVPPRQPPHGWAAPWPPAAGRRKRGGCVSKQGAKVRAKQDTKNALAAERHRGTSSAHLHVLILHCVQHVVRVAASKAGTEDSGGGTMLSFRPATCRSAARRLGAKACLRRRHPAQGSSCIPSHLLSHLLPPPVPSHRQSWLARSMMRPTSLPRADWPSSSRGTCRQV